MKKKTTKKGNKAKGKRKAGKAGKVEAPSGRKAPGTGAKKARAEARAREARAREAREREARERDGAASSTVPPDFRRIVEETRLGLRAVFRSLDQLGIAQERQMRAELRELIEIDADLAEALSVLDRPLWRYNLEKMVSDIRGSISRIPEAQERLFATLAKGERHALVETIPAVRAGLFLDEAYLDIPGKDPVERSRPIRFDGDACGRLGRLPAAKETWIGGRRPTSMNVQGPDNRFFRPDIAVWINSGTGEILGLELLRPEDKDDKLLDLLFSSMQDPKAGEPRRPEKVGLSERRLARSMDPALTELGIEVLPCDGRMLDDVVKIVEAKVKEGKGGQSSPQGYLQGGCVSVEDVSQLFRAAARLYKSVPWDTIRPEHVIDVRIGRWGVDHLCVVIPPGTLKALVAFYSFDDMMTFFQGLDALSLREEKSPIMVPLLSVTFVTENELDDEARKEVARERWSVADPDAFPSLMKLDEIGRSIPLHREEHWVLTAVAEGIAHLFTFHPDLLDDADPEELVEDYPSAIWPDLKVRIAFPHPEFTQ